MLRAGMPFASYTGYAIERDRRPPRERAAGRPDERARPRRGRRRHASTTTSSSRRSLLILVGGDETTRHVISGGMAQLLAHPDQREQAARDRDLSRLGGRRDAALGHAHQEHGSHRHARRRVRAASRCTRARSCCCSITSANRDEDVFDDPHRFDIERQPNDHVAFGFGTHFCLGASLARLEVKVMVDRLLTPPARPASSSATHRCAPANFISGFESMPVTFTPTAPVGASRPERRSSGGAHGSIDSSYVVDQQLLTLRASGARRPRSGRRPARAGPRTSAFQSTMRIRRIRGGHASQIVR